MLNKRGQALVEFILILPVFLMILFVIVDFGMIFNAKSSLENDTSDIVLMVENGDDINNIQLSYPKYDISIKKSDDNKYYNIYVKSYVDIVTPGMNLILDDPYPIYTERVIPYEESK